ncbi:MAG: CBS domain-containing protein [Rhodospirillales bacterium]|nr:CBS domain-containing protein [Alphaproteobacteria bacterium]USO04406.1 MAG: CBS domain-containing protein [Rhodospirillales bacterium]
MKIKDVPAFQKNMEVLSMDIKTTVLEAAREMEKRNVGSVIVTEGKMLCGIVTERDLLRRVVAKNISPDGIFLEDIMTSKLDIVTPEDTTAKAVELMTNGNFRHLPVVGEYGEVISMLSQRDFYAALRDLRAS